MIAVGIDIGKAKHAAAIIDEHGRQLAKPTFYTADRKGAERLLAEIRRHASPQDAVVGMEATGNYGRGFQDFFAEAGCRIDMINPIESSASMSRDVRGRKSDKGDAVAIANVLLDPRHVSKPTGGDVGRPLRELARTRSFLVGQRSAQKLYLESLLAEAFPEYEAFFDDVFCPCSIALLKKYPTAATLSTARTCDVAKVIKAHTRGKNAKDLAERLVAAARDSLCVGNAAAGAVAKCMKTCLAAIEELDGLVKEMEDEMEAAETPEMAKTLMQIKGSGKILPKAIAAEYGALARFDLDPKTGARHGMARRMLAFAGCEPRLRESGKWRGRVLISKRGSGQLRTALYLMANSIRMYDPFFKALYDEKIKTKHHNVALFYVVAKLLNVVCSLYRSRRNYTVQPPEKSYQH